VIRHLLSLCVTKEVYFHHYRPSMGSRWERFELDPNLSLSESNVGDFSQINPIATRSESTIVPTRTRLSRTDTHHSPQETSSPSHYFPPQNRYQIHFQCGILGPSQIHPDSLHQSGIQQSPRDFL